MTWDDTGLLVVTGSVTGQLEDFGSEVLEDGSEVDWGTSSDTLSVVTLPQKTVDTSDWESETGLGRAAVISKSVFDSGENERSKMVKSLEWISKSKSDSIC